MVGWEVLSPDLKVACKIYECETKKEEIWFSKLVDALEGDVSRTTISKSIDKLFDLGIIDGEWKKVKTRWYRVFKIAGEASVFIKNIYLSTKNR